MPQKKSKNPGYLQIESSAVQGALFLKWLIKLCPQKTLLVGSIQNKQCC